jgi:C4-dicarboxylate-specific signal transduction histidine kinase
MAGEAESGAGSVVRAEAMLAMADLLGGVLHDLNNPLSAVLGQAHVLKERFPLGPDRTAAERISRAADRLARIARSFVLVARETREQATLLSLNAVIEETLPVFAYPLALHGIAPELALAPASPSLFARPRDVRLLVVGLLAPVLEAAGTEPPARLRIATARPRRELARLEVSCPGGSLDPTFEPRVLRAAGRPSLYLAARQATRLGGSLSLEGSVLRVDLPAHVPAKREVRTGAAPLRAMRCR